MMKHLNGCRLPEGRTVHKPLTKNQINTAIREKRAFLTGAVFCLIVAVVSVFVKDRDAGNPGR
jgi:hypothetical protein